jgi:hypothetical protein
MFIVLIKNIIDVHIKQASFWPSAGVQPMPNDRMHAMPWQCLLAISIALMLFNSCCIVAYLSGLVLHSKVKLFAILANIRLA